MSATPVVVLGGGSWNQMVHLPKLPDGRSGTYLVAPHFEALGSTGIGKALALKALGYDPVLHIAIGRDAEAEKIRAGLAARGVRLIYDETEELTARHLNLMDPKGQRVSIFLQPGASNPKIDTARMAPHIAEARAIFLGLNTSCPPLFEAVAAAEGTVLADLHDWDGKSTWHAPFYSLAQVVQVSEDVLEEEPGAVATLQAAGAGQVVITRGSQGADIHIGRRQVRVSPAAADMVDSNGAGDMFQVALWHGQSEGWSIERAGRFAAAAAALCVEDLALVPEGLSISQIEDRAAES